VSAQKDEQLEQCRRVLRAEGDAVLAVAERLGSDPSLADAAGAIFKCTGKVVLTGIGKAGIIAEKISATLASTGTLSIFLHPVEALHGDLGRLQREDLVVALSNSGSSEELIRLVDHIKSRGAKLIALTGNADSPLANHAEVTICYGAIEEACPHGLAPTVSTTVMLAVGDALALAVMDMRNFKPEDYATFHPGGALGRRFLRVEEVMTFRKGEQLSIASDKLSLGEALAEAEKVERRSGAMLLVDGDGRLSGIMTDADLRRLLVMEKDPALLDRPVSEVMTVDPKRVRLGELASEAEAVFNRYRIDELPVVDEQDRPVGVIDVQDVLGISTLGEE
jgi:arabinose-5-phosphate isomerase